MTGWMIDKADLTVEELKKKLPLPYVVAESGVDLDASADGRLVGLCPFHEERNPSFAIWDEDGKGLRVGCWSCDFGPGDVLDYIARWKDTDFKGAVGTAKVMLAEFDESAYEAPEFEDTSEPVDLLSTARAAFAGYKAGGALDEFIETKDGGMPYTAEWLRGTWWVGELDGQVYVPHFGRDANDLVAMKRRRPDDHLYAVKGSKLKYLYGTWLDGKEDRVILCEGESDTWMVSWALREQTGIAVLGLPSGADSGIRDEWVDQLRDREVVILFDGDTVGREAAKKWAKALHGVADTVRICDVPTGMDASKLGEEAVVSVVGKAVEVRDGLSSQYITVGPDGYIRTKSGEPICDWTFEPIREIQFEDGTLGYEDARGWVLTGMDALSDSRLRTWATRHGKVWTGSTRDAQMVFKSFTEQGPGLPKGNGALQVGWYDGAFVTVTEAIGPRAPDYVYVPGEVSAQFKRIVTFDKMATRDMEAMVEGLLGLHRPDVVHPIVGWVAASVTRPMFREFPTLGVVGGSGAGKTTLVDAVMTAFGFGGGEQNLTSTTRYGLSTLVSGSCGVPVWVDEYRPGAQKDTLVGMEQIIRDAWTGASSLRGGVGNNWSEVAAKAATAPLVVSGEDVFSETSLLERVVLLKLPLNTSGRSADALRRVRVSGQFGRAWVEWLQYTEWGLPAVEGKSRPEVGVEIVRWGWELWRRWLRETAGLDVGEANLRRVEWYKDDPDMTDVEKRRQLDQRLPPFHELLLWGEELRDREDRPLVWTEGDATYVRVRALHKIAREHQIALPGGERAMADWLIERFGGSLGYQHRTEFGRALLLDRVEGIDERLSGWEG